MQRRKIPHGRDPVRYFWQKKRKIVKSGSFFNFLSGNIIECVFLSCKSVSVVTAKIVLGDSRMSSGDSNL